MTNVPPIEAIVLAAGSSMRLGRPKALVDLRGKTALERLLETLASVGIASGVVVGGEHLDAIRARVDAAPLHYALNPSPEAGRTGSVVIGLAVTNRDADVLLWPVDRPLATPATVRSLLEARARDLGEDVVVVPESDGRHGHPILLASGLRPAILAALPDTNLREILTRAKARRIAVPTDDPLIHANLDTAQDVVEAIALLS